MNKRRKRKRQIFYHHIELVYNNPTLVISEELRQALLNSASGIEKGDSIAYLLTDCILLFVMRSYTEKPIATMNCLF